MKDFAAQMAPLNFTNNGFFFLTARFDVDHAFASMNYSMNLLRIYCDILSRFTVGINHTGDKVRLSKKPRSATTRCGPRFNLKQRFRHGWSPILKNVFQINQNVSHSSASKGNVNWHYDHWSTTDKVRLSKRCSETD
jgi:hypothetical protein